MKRSKFAVLVITSVIAIFYLSSCGKSPSQSPKTTSVTSSSEIKISSDSVAFKEITGVTYEEDSLKRKQALDFLEKTIGIDSLASYIVNDINIHYYKHNLYQQSSYALSQAIIVKGLNKRNLPYIQLLTPASALEAINSCSDNELMRACEIGEYSYPPNSELLFGTIADKLSISSLSKFALKGEWITNYVPLRKRKVLLKDLSRQSIKTLAELSVWNGNGINTADWYRDEAKRLCGLKIQKAKNLSAQKLTDYWYDELISKDILISKLGTKKFSEILEISEELNQSQELDVWQIPKNEFKNLLTRKAISKEDKEALKIFYKN